MTQRDIILEDSDRKGLAGINESENIACFGQHEGIRAIFAKPL